MLKVYLLVEKDGETYLEPKVLPRKEAKRLIAQGKAQPAESDDQKRERVERLGEKNAAFMEELEEAFGGDPDSKDNIDAAWRFPEKDN